MEPAIDSRDRRRKTVHGLEFQLFSIRFPYTGYYPTTRGAQIDCQKYLLFFFNHDGQIVGLALALCRLGWALSSFRGIARALALHGIFLSKRKPSRLSYPNLILLDTSYHSPRIIVPISGQCIPINYPLSQEPLMQTSIDRNHMSRRFAERIRKQQINGFRLIRGRYGRFGQRTLGIEIS